jgi:hypothetical protein
LVPACVPAAPVPLVPADAEQAAAPATSAAAARRAGSVLFEAMRLRMLCLQNITKNGS